MRNYPGSSPYSAEEMQKLAGSLEANAAEVKTRGVEIATFLRWLIETENLPPVTQVGGSDERTGGVSLLSWSGGNFKYLSLFAHAADLPSDTRDLLGKYLRNLILYGQCYEVRTMNEIH